MVKYNSINNNSGITCKEDLPLYFQDIINEIIIKYPDITIAVFGSYYNGDYINETSSREDIEKKKKFKESIGKKFRQRSDLDLCLSYEIPLKFDEVDMIVCDENFGIIIYKGIKNLN